MANDVRITTHESCVGLIQETGNRKLEQVIPASVGFDPRGGQRMTGSGEVPLVLVSEDALNHIESDVEELYEMTRDLGKLSHLTPPTPSQTLQIIKETIEQLARFALIAGRLHRNFELSEGVDVPNIFYDGYCDDADVL